MEEGHAASAFSNFSDFLLHQLNAPENLQRQANQRYQTATQREGQSVRTFVEYLKQWERNLKESYTDSQRKEHLRARLVPKLRDEILRHPNEPDSYEQFVGWLQTIENLMPERRNAITNRKKTGDKGDRDQKGKSAAAPRRDDSRGGAQRDDSQPRKRERSSTTSIEYFYCHKLGHKRSEYRKMK